MLLQILGHAGFLTPPCLCVPSAVQRKHKHANVRSALLAWRRCLALRCVYAVGSCALLAWPANDCSRRYFKDVALSRSLSSCSAIWWCYGPAAAPWNGAQQVP